MHSTIRSQQRRRHDASLYSVNLMISNYRRTLNADSNEEVREENARVPGLSDLLLTSLEAEPAEFGGSNWSNDLENAQDHIESWTPRVEDITIADSGRESAYGTMQPDDFPIREYTVEDMQAGVQASLRILYCIGASLKRVVISIRDRVFDVVQSGASKGKVLLQYGVDIAIETTLKRAMNVQDVIAHGISLSKVLAKYCYAYVVSSFDEALLLAESINECSHTFFCLGGLLFIFVIFIIAVFVRVALKVALDVSEAIVREFAKVMATIKLMLESFKSEVIGTQWTPLWLSTRRSRPGNTTQTFHLWSIFPRKSLFSTSSLFWIQSLL
jgi:hypothetical protein